MKKYIYLKEGEIITPDVELHDPEGRFWEGNDYTNTPVAKNWVGYFRRPIPHTGNVQFLMCMSPLVTVIVNCDGKTQEEIEQEAGRILVEKILANLSDYIHFENIDWAKCEVDEIQPEPKNPGKYRYLEAGEYTKAGDETLVGREWVVLDESDGGMLVTKRSPMEYRRPITEPQYRPFKEGDVIEKGDQWRWNANSEWQNAGETIIGDKVVGNIAGHDDWRKLIK